MATEQEKLSIHELRGINAEVLIVHAEYDEIVSRSHAEQIVESIPSANFKLLPGVSHGAPTQNPGQFNKEIERFLLRVAQHL
jgi:pimeloyl-ACP methyl ester carboxylesterase